MKGLGSRITKGLCTGSLVACNDNSGAKMVQIIGIRNARANRNTYPAAGIGDIVTVAVKKGTLAMKKKILKAVIVRQRKEYKRANGMRIQFEDNAVVVIDDQGLPVGTEIKGAIAREVADRFPKVAAVAAAVI